MTIVDQTTLRSRGFAFAPRLTRAIEGLAAEFAARSERRTTRNALSNLSERQLEDIGLNRADIDRLF